MKPSELKYLIEQAGHSPLFFSRENMRFAGDTMANYGCRSATIQTDWTPEGEYACGAGEVVEAWELYRKRPVNGGLRESVYFEKTTLRRVRPTRGVTP